MSQALAERVLLRKRNIPKRKPAAGKVVAVIAAVPTDFRTDGGSWQRIRPRAAAAADGSSQALENSIRVHSHADGISVTDRKGRGLTWLLPREAETRADGVDLEIAGTRWSYTLTRYGIKAETVVAKPRGAREETTCTHSQREC